MANSVSEQCDNLERDRPLYDHHVPSIALIPYFGGPPEAYGNSHSLSPRAIKLAQTRGAICAASRYFHQVSIQGSESKMWPSPPLTRNLPFVSSVKNLPTPDAITIKKVAVGVCFPQDAADIRGLGFAFVEVVEVDCGG